MQSDKNQIQIPTPKEQSKLTLLQRALKDQIKQGFNPTKKIQRKAVDCGLFAKDSQVKLL